MHIPFLLLSAVFVLPAALSISKQPHVSADSKRIEIRGIYGSPEPFWKKDLRLDQLGVNAVFMHDGAINENIMSRARAEGLKVFAEFATLNGKNYVNQHPEAWAIDQNGKKVEAATWFMGVCPTEPGFRQFRTEALKTLLRKFDLDGVWMDYLHYHAQFEDPEPILPETCFCDHCLSGFQTATGLSLPEENTAEKANWILGHHDKTWRNWRCTVIAGWVRDFKKILKEEKPGALLGIYHCPWNDDEFDGARRRILGLDYDLLREHADVFSPMVYHGRMGRDPEWVKENISWFTHRLNIQPDRYPKVWPIVQAHNDPGVITAEAFEKVLRYGAIGRSSGVMMFTSHSVAEEEEKTAIMKKVPQPIMRRRPIWGLSTIAGTVRGFRRPRLRTWMQGPGSR